MANGCISVSLEHRSHVALHGPRLLVQEQMPNLVYQVPLDGLRLGLRRVCNKVNRAGSKRLSKVLAGN
jgi:hypothetical protein